MLKIWDAFFSMPIMTEIPICTWSVAAMNLSYKAKISRTGRKSGHAANEAVV